MPQPHRRCWRWGLGMLDAACSVWTQRKGKPSRTGRRAAPSQYVTYVTYMRTAFRMAAAAFGYSYAGEREPTSTERTWKSPEGAVLIQTRKGRSNCATGEGQARNKPCACVPVAASLHPPEGAEQSNTKSQTSTQRWSHQSEFGQRIENQWHRR